MTLPKQIPLLAVIASIIAIVLTILIFKWCTIENRNSHSSITYSVDQCKNRNYQVNKVSKDFANLDC